MVVIVVLAGLILLWRVGVLGVPGRGGAPTTQEVKISLFDLLETGNPEAVKARLADGVDVDARNEVGQTPLMMAAADVHDVRILEALLAAGADIDATTEAGWTALMYAAANSSSPEVVLSLMNAGANPTLTGAAGETVLSLARQNPAVASTGIIARLQELLENPYTPGWPSGYLVPVEGATISSRPSHLPGAPRAYRNGTHQGFDFYNGTVSVAIEYGTPVRAVAAGRVIRADHDYVESTLEQYNDIIATAKRSLTTPPEILDKLRGRQVWIQHPGGFISRYAHLSAIPEAITVGVEVQQGQMIGEAGNSGTSEAAEGTREGPHPHVEIWRGDTYLGEGLESTEIYQLAAQVFGVKALPPYTE